MSPDSRHDARATPAGRPSGGATGDPFELARFVAAQADLWPAVRAEPAATASRDGPRRACLAHPLLAAIAPKRAARPIR